MPLVVDASITLAWCLEDEQSDYADEVFSRLRAEHAMVPSLWPIEVANGLLFAERAGRLSAAGTAQAQSLLSGLPVEIQDAPLSTALGPILALAREHSLTTYDAAYLELAMREGVPLATVDGDLRTAASASGVPLA